MEPILTVKNLSKAFGGLLALKDISIKVDPGQIVGIIGPNGAGKTTFFNCLSCLYRPTDGQIEFENTPLVPVTSSTAQRRIRIFAVIFMVAGILRLPLFWSLFLPQTFFKVEVFLLGIFILSIRFLLVRGIMAFEIWAWGLMYVFLLSDLAFALWFLTHTSGMMLLLNIPLYFFSVPWSVGAGALGVYLMVWLGTSGVRHMYGFRPGPDVVCRMGMARTFQNIRLFFNLSVLDNVLIGRHGLMESGLGKTLLKSSSQKKEESVSEAEGLRLLRFVGLEDRAFELADTLAYGEQRRLEIARALASEPRLLLLDEPAAGMNPQESLALVQLVRKIQARGVAILIIEHDMKVMMNLADYIYVFDYGGLISEGTPDAVREDEMVIAAYLGKGHATC